MLLNLTSLLFITCLTGPSAGLFVKCYWLCRLIRSSRRPDCSVPVCQRVHSIACYPALCIEWRYRDLVHAHSVHLVALTPQGLHFLHLLFLSEESFFVVLVLYLPFDHIFFTPFAFFMLLAAFLIEHIFGLSATASSISSPPHSSFILSMAFLFLAS